MSIASSVYADYANRQKEEWTDQLEAMLNDQDLSDKDKLQVIAAVVKEIKKFWFSE